MGNEHLITTVEQAEAVAQAIREVGEAFAAVLEPVVESIAQILRELDELRRTSDGTG